MAKFDFRVFVLLLTVVLMVVDQAKAKAEVCEDKLNRCADAADAELCRKQCGYIHGGKGQCVETENSGGGFSYRCVCYYECHHDQ
ncbi:defensin-like protein 125 [Rhododendron vialii]|uniref:defensin-like protein 125 n=1 Tax=Rhododendron vialii TaxID=182163 RepID=UPI0026605333|nr:defensin-like protein 125 [Rhododendron vialii]